MNKNLYRLVFSERHGMLVAVSEVTARQGKAASGEGEGTKTGRAGKLALAIALSLAGLGSVYANPVGGVVTAGSGKISQNGSQMTINQGSQNLAINWQSFNINTNESVIFNQPNTSSIALNRVIGTDGSKILGHLDANGQVFLINPNGILFGKGAQVSTGGLVASTLNLSEADFLAGKRTFSGDSHAGVTNQGTLNAHEGGYVALLGNQVSNQGVITAKLGSVGLAAGSQVTLDLAGDQLLNVKVDGAAFNALAENHGLIQADGGQVVMTASARDALLNTVVNNDGVIQAQTVENQGGVIKLLGGETGTTVVGGRLDASAPQGGNGGSIETSGAHVKVADSAQISTAAETGKTGQWLVDPTDFTVAAAGGDITGATLSSELNANNVTLQSSQGTANTNGSGNINVTDNVSWGANTTLTLQSVNDININRNLTATGDTAGLTLSPGSGRYNLGPGAQVTLSGATPSLVINGNSYTIIKDANGLQNMSNNLSGNYALGTNVDASATSTWNSNAGFNPVGGSSGFAGRLDGLGHTISSLVINRPFSSYDGLFGSTTSSANIRNVGLVGGSVTGSEYVGDLVGANLGTISNSYATGTVNGQPYTYQTYTTHCGWFGCTVTATPHIVNSTYVGGLAGYNAGTIANSYATGSVNEINSASQYGNVEFGGLVGRNDSNGVIRNSYATGAVSGSNTLSVAGGLAGSNYGTIGNSYAIGSLSIGGNDVGGLTGYNIGSIATSYATGSAAGNANVGGLVGLTSSGSTINNSYASGSVSGTSQVNGLVGNNTGTITNSAALTPDQMKDAANFSGFDFSNTWRIYEGHTTPLLLSFLKPLTITANSAAKTYDGTTYQGNNGLTCGDVSCADSHLYDTSVFSGTAQGARNAGTYTLVSDAYSDQQGYNINSVAGTLTINKANLNLSSVSDSKVYDGTTASSGSVTVSGLVAGDSINGLGQSFDSRNAGSRTLSVNGGYAINDGNNGNNYTVITSAANGTITPKALTVIGQAAQDKTYDGTTSATLQGGALSGVIGSDNVNLVSGAGAFSDKNAGTNKAVTVTGTGLGGTDAGNYTVANPTGLTATINKANLTVSATAANKVYDGTTTATASLSDNRIAGDSLSDSYTAANFADKNAGTGKTVTVNGISISGTDAGNYNLVDSSTSASATISKANLALSAVADTKTYDGTTASKGAVTETGLVSGDSISNLSQSFDSKNAGARTLAVSGGYTINDGNNGNNYTITTNTAGGTIGQASLALSAVSDSKVYDGTTASSGVVQEAGLVNGDSISNLSQSFDSKNAGARTLAVNSGYAINDGNNGNNYAVTTKTSAGSITPKALTVTGETAADKTYDATTNATLVGGTLSGVVGGDNVGLVSGTGTFSDKNVGTNKAVTVAGTGLSGTDAGNYTVANATGLTANITPAALTLAAGADSKVYDGTTASAGTVSVTGLMGSDSVTGVNQSFDSKNAGNRTLSVNGGYTVNDGNNGNNYTVATSSASGSITPRALNIIATGQNKTYDGTTTATVTLADNRVTGDSMTDAYASANFADKNAGSGKTVTVSGLSISGTDAGNYTVANTTTTTTADIGKAALALAAVADSKTYDGTDASAGTVTVNGLVGGDSISGVSQSFDSRNAGNRTLSVNGGYTINDGNNGNNYTVATSTAAGAIAKAILNLSAVSDSKVYDGTTASNGAVTVSGLVTGDSISNLGQSFDSKNAGSRTLAVNGGYTVNDGNNGNNYTVATNSASGSITPKALAVTGQTAQDKTYDGTTSATLQGGSLSGVVGSDSVNLVIGTGAFADKNAGANKAVTVTGTGLNGSDAGNYTVTDPTGLTATINKANLTVSATAANKVYDGTTAATASLSDNRIAGDSLSDSYTAANFADKNAGTGKQVTVSGISISGTDAGNYNLVNSTASATADVTPAALALGAVADSKVYDGTTASGGAVTVNGLVGGDSISGVSQSFDSKNAGTRTLAVNGGYTISDGNNGNNYTVTTSTASGSISKASLALSAVTDTKVYDGTTASSGAAQQAGLVGGDSITGLSQSFDSKNVGPRTLSVNSGYTINDGNNGDNYTVTTNTAAGAITPKGLTVTGQTAVDKTYDATTHAALNGGTLTGVVGGDNVGMVNGTGTFSDKNVGANKAVTVTGTGLSGSDAGNYTVTDPTGLTASITPATLTVSASASNKVYDGTIAATAALTDNRFSGDSLSVSATGANFADKNAGNGKTVTVNGIAISGADAGNYTLAGNTATTTANITPAPLTLGAVTDTKTYDGTTASTGAVQVTGLVGGDTIGNTSQSFDSKNAGARTLVVNSGYAINDGNNGNNYTVTTTTADGTITKASLALSAVSDSKVYDGTTASQGAVQTSGLMAGDSITGLSQVFDSKNAGDRTLSVNSYTINDGNNGQNYSVTTTTASGTISKAQLVLGAVSDSKIFDNTTDSTAAVQITGLATGDSVSNLSESFDKKTPGDRTLLVNGGYVVNDGNNGQNYTVTTTTAGGYIFPPGCDHTSCPK